MRVQEILDIYRSQSFSEPRKGERFARLMQAFLRTSPLYSSRFKQVWLWEEFPARQALRQIDMAKAPENFAQTGKEVRQQLGFSQEELAHELGVSFSTVNRWENSRMFSVKLARRQFEAFCTRMAGQGKLNLDNKDMQP